MVLTSFQLFFIFLLFVGFIIVVAIFAFRYRSKNVLQVARELGWKAYTSEESIPVEYQDLGEKILQFQSFEWLMVGEVQGKKVFFTQYITTRLSQWRYEYAIFSLFDTPFSDEKLEPVKTKHKLPPDFLVTRAGIFFSHGIPWKITHQNIFPIIEQVVEIRNQIESR